MLSETPATRLRPVNDLPALAERAADLLRTPQTRLPLTFEEAGHVVSQMGIIPFPAGSTVLHVYAESNPVDGFVAVEPDLEDVYFHRLAEVSGGRVPVEA